MTPLAYQTPERAKCWCRRPPQGSMPSASSESCSPLRRSTPGRGDPERRKWTRPGAVGNHKADPLVSDLHTLDRSSNELTDLLRPKSFFRPTESRGFGLVVDRLANGLSGGRCHSDTVPLRVGTAQVSLDSETAVGEGFGSRGPESLACRLRRSLWTKSEFESCRTRPLRCC